MEKKYVVKNISNGTEFYVTKYGLECRTTPEERMEFTREQAIGVCKALECEGNANKKASTEVYVVEEVPKYRYLKTGVPYEKGKHFLEYLKGDVVVKYLENYKKAIGGADLKHLWDKLTNPSFSNGFSWLEAEEGFSYWNSVDDELRAFIKENS